MTDNPKDAQGAKKAPLQLVPPALLIEVAPAMASGAAKYGAFNWRKIDVRSSIYAGAMLRHLSAWMDGEDLDPDSGISHLAHIGSCVAVLVDAKANGNLIDDRVEGPAAELLALQDHSDRATGADVPGDVPPSAEESTQASTAGEEGENGPDVAPRLPVRICGQPDCDVVVAGVGLAYCPEHLQAMNEPPA